MGRLAGHPADRAVVVIVMVVLPEVLPAGIDAGLNVTEVAAGLPVAENVMVLVVGPPVRLIVKLAGWPAVTVTAVGGPEMLKSTPVPVSGTACGLVAALSAMLSEALFLAPIDVGRNVGVIAQVPLGAMVAGNVPHVLVWVN